MKILAFMQNQWFKNPAAVKVIFDRNPGKRNELIKRLLFSGCVSGQRLRTAFGSDLCNAIIWEEASPQMAGHSSGSFAANVEHMKAAIKQHQPDLIICFGKIASDAMREIGTAVPVYNSPHPAARGRTIEAMQNIANRIMCFDL